jgi:hypothetical protein
MSRVIDSIGLGLLACVIVAFVACGGGSGEQQAADTAQQAPATGQAANPMAEMATKGESSMKATIIDTGFNGLLLMPYQMFLSAGYSQENDEGYEKSTTVAGFPGWEKWSTSNKSGEVHALVNKRFLMHVEGENLGGIKELHQVVQQTDLKKLEGMK